MSLTDREWDDLKSLLDKAVYKFLGFSEPSLVTAALNCIDKGYDERKTSGGSLYLFDYKRTELQIRGSTEDHSEIIFLISQ